MSDASGISTYFLCPSISFRTAECGLFKNDKMQISCAHMPFFIYHSRNQCLLVLRDCFYDVHDVCVYANQTNISIAKLALPTCVWSCNCAKYL